MKNTSRIWQDISQSSKPIVQLDKNNYKQAFEYMKNFFNTGNNFEMYTSRGNYPQDRQISHLDKIVATEIASNNVGHVHTLMLEGEEFILTIQCDTYARHYPSDSYSSLVSEPGTALLYVANDRHVGATPEEYVFKKKL